MIQLLYDNGADLNAKDTMDRTPMYLAAKANHSEAVKLLLVLQADPTIRCSKKLRPEDVTEDDSLRSHLIKSKMFMITQNWA